MGEISGGYFSSNTRLPKESEEAKKDKERHEILERFTQIRQESKQAREIIAECNKKRKEQCEKADKRIVPCWGAILAGTVAGSGYGLALGYIRRGGNFRRIDNIKEYFLNHPDSLEHAKQVTGSNDLNYIAGFVSGDDSAAHALFTSSGLEQFFWDANNSALVDGLIATAVLGGIPAATTILGMVSLKHSIKKLEKKQENAEKKRSKLEWEICKLSEKYYSLEAQAGQQRREEVSELNN